MRTLSEWIELINSRLSGIEYNELWSDFILRPAVSTPAPGEIVTLKYNLQIKQGTILKGSTAVFQQVCAYDISLCRAEMLDITWEHEQKIPFPQPPMVLSVDMPRWVIGDGARTEKNDGQ